MKLPSRSALLGLPLGLLACDDQPKADDTAAPEPGREWQVMVDGLEGVALSIWGVSRTDVWVAGSGPTVLHLDGTEWSQLDPGVDNDAWWITGDGIDSTLWIVGDDGLVLHHDPSEGSFTRLDAGTDATLFGAWGSPDGTVYAVGGFIAPDEGEPVIVHIRDGEASLVDTLPSGRDLDEAYFKVWGSAADDVWVIGDGGSILHYDGSAWSVQSMPGYPRLVTLHGAGADDMVVVGGSTQGVIYERRDGAPWDDRSPSALPPLNGVFVTASGSAAATGMMSQTLERVNGVWTPLEQPPVLWDWHATWVDEEGGIWVAGGDFIELMDGAVFRYGEP